MTADSGNWESKLGAKVREARAAAPEPAPAETTEPTPVIDAAPASAPEASPEITPVTESTSEVVAVPAVQAAEGSTPEVEPAPASDVPSTSAVEALSKRGFKVEDPKLAADYLRVESELAAMKRAEKAAKAQQATEKQPEATPASPEPTPVASPVVAAPQFAASAPTLQTEHPSGSVALPPEYEQEVARLVAEDSTCRAIAAEYKNLESRLSANTQLDENQWVVGGRMFDLNNEIAGLQQALTAPPEVLKKHGFEVPTLDALQRQDIEARVQVLKGERRDLIDEYHATAARRDRLRDTFHDRANQYRSTFEQKALHAKAEADQLADVDSRAEAFKDRWVTERDSAYKANNVSEGMRPRLDKLLKLAAQAHITEHGAIYNDDLPQIIAEVVREELQKADEYHRERSADYAKAKIADVKTATPAPPAAAAVAPPAPTENPNWEKRLMAKRRVLFAR